MDFLIPADLTIPEFLRREIKPPLSDYERDDRESDLMLEMLKERQKRKAARGDERTYEY